MTSMKRFLMVLAVIACAIALFYLALLIKVWL